jgi:hypothetical protein
MLPLIVEQPHNYLDNYMHNVMAVEERRSRREIFENERNEIGISYAWLFNLIQTNKQTKPLYYNTLTRNP